MANNIVSTVGNKVARTGIGFDPFREMEDAMNRLQSMMMTGLPRTSWGRDIEQGWNPAADLDETGESYEVHAELPGIAREDVRVAYDDGLLTLSGERRAEREEKKKKYHRVERTFGRFERSFLIPGAIDDNKISAQFKDGVLHVVLPKLQPTNKPARTIHVSG